MDGDDQVIASHFNGPGIDNKIRQTDHLGSTTALTNDSGVVVEGIEYDSFGNSLGSSLARYTYTGREFDADTGLMYYRARWYDPQAGRFISEDPIGLSAWPNPYEYACDKPAKYVDPCASQPWLTPVASAAGPPFSEEIVTCTWKILERS